MYLDSVQNDGQCDYDEGAPGLGVKWLHIRKIESMTTILFAQLQAIVAVESSSDVTCWAGATRGQVRPVT